MKQLLVRWDNQGWGIETTEEMSQPSERCDVHQIDMVVVSYCWLSSNKC